MKPIAVEDLLTFKFLSQVTFSPAGSHLAFIVKQADVPSNGYRADICVVDLEDDAAVQVTGGGQNGPFAWSPDGTGIVYVSRARGGADGATLQRADVLTGETRKLAAIGHEIEELDLLDEKTVLYTARVSILPEAEQDGPEYTVFDELPFWRNSAKAVTNKTRVHLFLLDLESGDATELVGGAHDVAAFSHHGHRVFLVSKEFVDVEPVTEGLFCLDLDCGTMRCISEGEYTFSGAGGQPKPYLLDANRVAILGTDMKRWGIRQSADVLTFDLGTRSVANLTHWGDRHPSTPGLQRVLSDCRHGAGPVNRTSDGLVYVAAAEKDCVNLYAVNQAGDIERIAGTEGTIDSFDVHQGRIAYVALKECQLQEVYILDGNTPRQLTRFNQDAFAGRSLSVPEPFAFSAQDGTAIDAWIMRPFGFKEGEKYPAILFVRGGPKATSGPVFMHELQVMAGQGYVVYYCNPRGSAGRGDAFGDLRGKWGTVDYDDLLALNEHVLANYAYVDPERLGVMGGSYGGFMVNWMIGHTDVFRAACSQRSVASWHTTFCICDDGYYFTPDQVGGTPWGEDAGELIWRYSPLRYADRVKTPTLFINSDLDYMCHMADALQMFGALKYHGVDTRFVLFHGENHDLSRTGRPRNRILRLQAILKWFDQYLRPPVAGA